MWNLNPLWRHASAHRYANEAVTVTDEHAKQASASFLVGARFYLSYFSLMLILSTACRDVSVLCRSLRWEFFSLECFVPKYFSVWCFSNRVEGVCSILS